MGKIKIEVTVDCVFDWSYDTEISQIRKDLDAFEELGATHIEIYSADYSRLSMNSKYTRLETDEEFTTRINKYKSQEKIQRAKDLEQLRKLKEKYENPTAL